MSKAQDEKPVVDESLLLSKAVEDIDRNIYLAKRGFDQGSVPTALAHMSALIQHLRTSKLSPDNYYDLWMRVTECLLEVESHFDDQNNQAGSNSNQGCSVMQLHETVQYCGDILPRLYLLITVSSTYIRSKRAPAKDVLFDLVELCRGVQHPMRGLFLRSYLSQMAKDKLPDVGSEYEGFGGNVNDAIEFILQNFGEMNKLWVRMQHQGPNREKTKREKQRRALRQLIGSNLVRLSHLEGLTVDLYENEVLPRLLEHIVNCKDVIAQEFLMECIIQVFSDDFHIRTLSIYLTALSQVLDKVNMKQVLVSLLNRLATFAKSINDGTVINKQVGEVFTGAFELLKRHANIVIETQQGMTISDKLSLYVALMSFVTSVHKDNISYVDDILLAVYNLLNNNQHSLSDPLTSSSVVDILSIPLSSLGIEFLRLVNFEPTLNSIQSSDRKQVALQITKNLLQTKVILDDVGTVDTLFSLLLPLIKVDEHDDPVEVESTQHLLAQLFHNVSSTDSDTQFKILLSVRKYFGQGGTARIEFTLPPVIYSAIELVEKILLAEQSKRDEVKIRPKRVFSFIHETITVLVEPFPEIALRLFMNAALVADKCVYEAIAYEFIAQAFMTYETEIADSKAQLSALNLIIATLPQMNNFSHENYDTLATKATQHCSRYIVKADQARAVANCAHLHWPPNKAHVGRDDKKVLSRLKRAVSVARDLIGNHTHLFVEILDKYLFFYDKGCPSVDVEIIKTLSAYIVECLSANDGTPQSQIAATHYANTLVKLQAKNIIN